MLRPGSRWKSAVCSTEAVLVRPGTSSSVPQCGGVDMVPFDEIGDPRGTVAAGFDGGSLIGKRYRDEAAGLEMLCTKAGAGTLGIDGRALEMVEAKKLPSSD